MSADRRMFMSAAFGLSLSPAVAMTASQDASAVLSWNEQRALDAFVRMRCAPQGGRAIWVYSGVLIGAVLGEVAKPLVRIEGASVTEARRLDDGRYRYELEETGYYCDLQSGAVLDEWTNPFTAKVVKPKHYRSAQSLLFAGARIDPILSQMPGGFEFTGQITRPVQIGESLWMGEDLYVTTGARPATATAPARPARTQASMASFRARAADLETTADRWVDCDLSYGTMNGFVDWLGMSDVPGLQNMRLVGRKFRDGADVPVWLVERIARDHPDFAQRLR